jgi:hypothetical protein
MSFPGGRTTTDANDPVQPSASSRGSALALLVAISLGLVAGGSEIANTSIGWHLATGRWILAHHAVPRSDPFSFTAEGTEWVDHEWLFQLIVALVETVGGAPALIALRALLVATLAILLYRFAIRSGLDPPTALVLTALCLYGASIRFFLRPELCTLLIAPAVVWIFVRRGDYRGHRWLVSIAVLMVVGANLHAGVLVVPPLLVGLLLAEVLRSRLAPRDFHPSLASGMSAVAVTMVAPIVNPYGWRLYEVPVRIAQLVGLPQIPNPEWISPTPPGHEGARPQPMAADGDGWCASVAVRPQRGPFLRIAADRRCPGACRPAHRIATTATGFEGCRGGFGGRTGRAVDRGLAPLPADFRSFGHALPRAGVPIHGARGTRRGDQVQRRPVRRLPDPSLVSGAPGVPR